jgi:hypothetical protein
MNLPNGQGMFVWRIKHCDGGDPAKIVLRCKENNIKWLALKIVDGSYEYAYNINYIDPLVRALKANGIDVWGWGWTYGRSGTQVVAHWEARKAGEITKKYDLSGYFIDAEHHWKGASNYIAQLYSRELRIAIGARPIALCTYRFPSLHQDFPWSGFDFDFHAPQIYWEQSFKSSAGELQTRQSLQELKKIVADKPIVPLGPCYEVGGWKATPTQRAGFVNELKASGCPGWSWWSYQHVEDNVWGELKLYDIPFIPPIPSPVPPDALNKLWYEACRRGWFND